MRGLTGTLAAAAIAIGGSGSKEPGAEADSPAFRTAVVAQAGGGEFRSIQEAVDAAPPSCSASSPWMVRVMPGTYLERVYVQREKRFIRLVGEDPLRTTISFDLCATLPGADGKPIGTFQTPTVWIDADDFTMENMTVANTAGAKGQALALRIDGDRVIFRNCRLLGWQDTVLGNRGRHYFDRCDIEGAVDFIFGSATEYYDHCELRCLGDGYITAASTPAGEPFGFVFADCRIEGENPGVRTYLGRPWRDFGSVMFLRTRMTRVVRPAGWHNWRLPQREKTARFAEFESSGEGAAPSSRVAWARTLGGGEASAITPTLVLRGRDGWRP